MQFKDLSRPLSRLFSKAPEDPPPAPADPIAALDTAPPASLIATALGDGDEALRAAAIGKLTDGESLRTLAGLRPDAPGAVPPGIERIAQQRLAQLIDAGAVDFEALCAPSANVDALLAVAGHCSGPERLSRALASLDDSQIARLGLGGPPGP